jgi:histone H3/H4
MMRILSADSMQKIPKSAVKKIVRENFGAIISDSAAEAISQMLDQKANKIAKYAVERSKEKKRKTVLEEDIEAYRLKFGD